MVVFWTYAGSQARYREFKEVSVLGGNLARFRSFSVGFKGITMTYLGGIGEIQVHYRGARNFRGVLEAFFRVSEAL